MTQKHNQKNIVNKIASKRVLDQNAVSFKSYDVYKKTADIIERSEFASGKRVSYRTDTSSTFNFKVNLHGTYSTTAQTI